MNIRRILLVIVFVLISISSLVYHSYHLGYNSGRSAAIEYNEQEREVMVVGYDGYIKFYIDSHLVGVMTTKTPCTTTAKFK